MEGCMNPKLQTMTLQDHLQAFKSIAPEHFKTTEFLEKYYTFFQDFFRIENLQNAEWPDIQTLGDHIHAFQSLALSRQNALGTPNHPIEHYRSVFIYLAHGDDPMEERIRNVLTHPEYGIKFFGESVWSEIIGQLFADRYVMFNYRDQFAIKLLGIDPGFNRGDTFADKYFKYNTAVQPVIEAYKHIVEPQTGFPVNLEVDQFFSYLYETYHADYSEFALSQTQLDGLMDRFLQHNPDFEDFTHPGDTFHKEELDYKHKALKRFREEMGLDTLKRWVAEGDGLKAVKELDKRISTNIIQYNSWRASIGSDDETICAILAAFLQAADATEVNPTRLKLIFQVTRDRGLKPAWDTLSVILWALNPDLYAPIKISYYRKLASDLGQELPKGRPTAGSFCKVMEWMDAFRIALEPYNPRDWIDVQSFIWVVCPGARKGDTQEIIHENATEKADTAEQRTWIIAPGENACYWDEWKRDGIIAIGWEELGNLRNYADREEIKKAIIRTYNVENPVHWSLTCFEFSRGMQPGDIILIKSGLSHVMGVGLVTSDYEYDDSRAEFHSYRHVNWLKYGDWELPPERKTNVKTLTDYTGNREWLEWFYDFANIDFKKLMETPETTEETTPLETITGEPAYFWLYINPRIWDPSDIDVGTRQTYTAVNDRGNKRRIYKHFESVKPGDLLVGYESTPVKAITSIFTITQPLHETVDGKCIEIELIEKLAEPIGLETLKQDPIIQNCEAFRNSQGSLFSLSNTEFEHIRSMIDEVTLDLQETRRMASVQEPPTPYTMADALEGLFMDEDRMTGILELLKAKKNIILQGPPGVGKSFIARRIAYTLIGFKDTEKVEMIQFHQSYAYEDFIQGFRPSEDGRFILRNGVFYTFCKRALNHPDVPFVFIIDEINRGNLSKIFGELMLLIEHDKRHPDFAVPLTYADEDSESFYIPPNVHMIGMMNTADRSLAMVDYALRRRFCFIDLIPAFHEPCFRTYLLECGVTTDIVDLVIQRMIYLNQQIATDSGNLGEGYRIGHSFFCPPDGDGSRCDRAWFERIVRYEIEPLLMEYWFDDRDKADSAIRRLTDV